LKLQCDVSAKSEPARLCRRTFEYGIEEASLLIQAAKGVFSIVVITLSSIFIEWAALKGRAAAYASDLPVWREACKPTETGTLFVQLVGA